MVCRISRLVCSSRKTFDTNTNLTTYLPLALILTFSLTLTLLTRVTDYSHGLQSRITDTDDGSDVTDDGSDVSYREQPLVGATDYSHGLQSQITVRDY